MTIFDLPTLDPIEAAALARALLSAYPVLRRIYDDAFIANLVRRRGAYDNMLLLRLVQPNDEMNVAYWDEVTNDLMALESEGSLDGFRAKLRRHDPASMESARTELFFAAWLKRHGVNIRLEPEVGARKCEFVAQTTPETWWEVKSPLDLPELRQDEAVLMDVQRRLRSIDQPFVLNLRKFDLTLERVAAAVNAIKRQIYEFHRDGGRPPRTFEADGLVVNAGSITRRSKGYLGTMLGKPHVFGNENAGHVVKRVIAAADQIPPEGAGIVVVDRTSSDWIDGEDVVDACYGEAASGVHQGEWVNRWLPGIFDKATTARISAVISYTRRWAEENATTMTVLHNPSAIVTLPHDFLAYEGVRHTRRVADGEGFVLVNTPDAEDADSSA